MGHVSTCVLLLIEIRHCLLVSHVHSVGQVFAGVFLLVRVCCFRATRIHLGEQQRGRGHVVATAISHVGLIIACIVVNILLVIASLLATSASSCVHLKGTRAGAAHVLGVVTSVLLHVMLVPATLLVTGT
jgi:hypothetical protein